MTPEAYNALCAGLVATSHVEQWGGDVWKVGGKVFAIGGSHEGHFSVSFKVTPMTFEILRDHPDCRPAPYLASRGMTWVQYYRGEALTDNELEALLKDSHYLVGSGLSLKKQRELGLI